MRGSWMGPGLAGAFIGACFNPEMGAGDGGTAGTTASGTTASGTAATSQASEGPTTTSGASTGETPTTAAATSTTDERTTTADPDTGATSGGPDTCGDGVLQDHEACEDGNVAAGDGCGAKCQREQLFVFVTSSTSPGAFGSLAVADGACVARVYESSVPALKARRPEKFVALLSAADEGAVDRVLDSQGLFYTRVGDGALVALDTQALLKGDLQAPIAVNDVGGTLGGVANCDNDTALVWTGTAPGGLSAADHCLSWSDPSGVGEVGVATALDGFALAACGRSCLAPAHFYCVENP